MVAVPTPPASGGLTLVGRPVLTGTLPVTPFGDRLVGILEADGQQPKVASLAATAGGEVIVLSLVGFDTSVSAALAKLHANKGLTFQPGADLAWSGSSRLTRLDQPYRQLSTPLAGTRERHALSLSRLAILASGCCIRPRFPTPPWWNWSLAPGARLRRNRRSLAMCWAMRVKRRRSARRSWGICGRCG